MEEDLETIQEKLEIIESLCTDDCINKSTVIKPLKYAIENLIARYKKLEEKYNSVLKEDLDDKYEEVLEKTFKKYIDKDFIPKSKIKEKIEELKKEIEAKRNIANYTNDRVEARILSDDINELYKVKKVLQELLD